MKLSRSPTPIQRTALLIALLVLLLMAGIAAAHAQAGGYNLTRWTVANGGGVSSGGSFTVRGTIGQHDAGVLNGGSFTVHGGFWSGLATETPISPTLDLAKTASSPIAAPGQMITFTLGLTVTSPTAIPAVLTDTLPISLTYVSGSVSGGATYDVATRQIQFNGSIMPGVPTIMTYRATVDSGVQPGSILANNAIASFNVSGVVYQLQRTAAVAVPNPAPVPTLVLIYANGDNSLSSDMIRLLNNAEQSASNPNAVVLMLLDGPAANDTYLYRLQGDDDTSCPNYVNPTCNGRYVLGQNLWTWSDDTANPYSLSEFLKGAIHAYPGAGQVILSIVGHGSGWYPNVLIGQPSAWDGQPGGLLWDQNPGSFLTTKGLGDALRWSYQATGIKVGLLDLDACLMSMSEVAYEVSDSVNYVLASENWAWAAFPYDTYLAPNVLDGLRSAAQIGAEWLSIQANLLRTNHYPFTLALVDESQLGNVRSAVETLATALTATLPTDSGKLAAAQVPGICFDSNEDSLIDVADNYCDLSGFARHLAINYAGNASVVNAASAVETAVSSAVLAEDHQNGVPYTKPSAQWYWEDLGGFSIYAPFHVDDWKRAYYNGDSLRFAQNSQWSNLLDAFWNASPPPPTPCTGECEPPPPINIAPIDLQAHAGHDNVSLAWTLNEPVGDLVGYHVLREISGTTFITLTTVTVPIGPYVDTTGLVTGTTYCYQVNGISSMGRVVAQSNISCATFGQLTLWVPDISAPPNTANVIVPVNLEHGDGLCLAALQMRLSYSNTIATANGTVSSTIYTQGYAFVANTSMPGQVSIAAINGTCVPLYGPGTLFNIGFNTIGSLGQISPLDFITGITYTVIYNNDDLVHPLPLALDNGSLVISNIDMRGDVNGDGVVNVADAFVALQIASGQITPTPTQVSACDVNGDAVCSAADATLILRYAAYGTWTGSSANSALRTLTGASSNSVRLALQPSGSNGLVITSTLTISNGSELAGGTFTFQYDSSRMTFSGVTLPALTGGFSVRSNVLQPGLARVAMSRNSAIAGAGAILQLQFTGSGDASSVRIVGADLNDQSGRDFVTSALQKQIVIGAWSKVFLPIVIR